MDLTPTNNQEYNQDYLNPAKKQIMQEQQAVKYREIELIP